MLGTVVGVRCLVSSALVTPAKYGEEAVVLRRLLVVTGDELARDWPATHNV